MLKIHKSTYKKSLFISITSILSIGAFLGFSALTYTPELSHAETVFYPKKASNISNIVYMQEMTPEVCQSMQLEKQYQLIDKRDNKTYWVAKLKDGNCWMTQNLDLDITEKGLSAQDTDIIKDWNQESELKPEQTQTNTPDFQSVYPGIDIVQSYDPGLRFCYIVSNCYYSNSANDGHDALGNYYSWGAATAGQSIKFKNSTSGDNIVATQSICPKGWQLPYSGQQYDNKSKSFYNLLNYYGLTSTTSNNNYSMTSAPLYYIYNGRVVRNELQPLGAWGYLASAVWKSGSGIETLFLNRDASQVNPSNRSSDTWPFIGHSIRCVSRDYINNIEVAVNNTISIDVVSDVEVKKSESNPSTKNFDAKVSSNQPYKLQLSSTNPTLTSSTSSMIIPSRSGALTTATNAWGIKLKDAATYSQITSTPTTFYTASGAEVKTNTFTIGISTSPDLPSGEYSTDITITATQN